jgi:1,4-dihydroxy-2-naphthoate octaprenyltransferase
VGVGVAIATIGQDLAFGSATIWWRAGLALVVSLALQVATNYANDYSDGIRGTDDVRVGPLRLVAGGLASPTAVKRAALVAFAVAGVAGLALAAVAGWWLLAVGAAAIAAGWLYTGGPKPYGYFGLGEVFVFTFFGIVATVGTVYVQIESFPAMAWWAGALVGCCSTALLVVNNLRDLPRDAEAGKRTLAVRIGDARTRWLYVALLAMALVLVGVVAFVAESFWPMLALISAPLVAIPVRIVRSGATGRDLIVALQGTAKAQLAIGVLLTVGLILSAL